MNTLFTLDELLEITGGSLKNDKAAAPAVSFISTDSRVDCHNSLFVPLSGERFDGHDYIEKAIDMGTELILVDEKHQDLADKFSTCQMIVVPDTLKAYQQLANAHRNRFNNLTLIAVTGSCGKTSAKEILKSIFSEAFGEDAVYATKANTNNHVGVPQNILNINDKHKVAIIELGTNHPGEIDTLTKIVEPDIALITSIGASHLEFFESVKNVALEKSSIFNGLKPNGTAVIPSDAPFQSILNCATIDKDVVTFGKDVGADFQCDYISGALHGSCFELIPAKDEGCQVNWSLTGKHQAVNAAGCAAVASSYGLELDVIIQGLQNCVLPGMRMSVVKHDGITWINDAYNANPDSMMAGLNWLLEFAELDDLVLVLGDMLELGEQAFEAHRSMIQFVQAKFSCAKIGLVGPEMKRALNSLDMPFEVAAFVSVNDAVPYFEQYLKPGHMVFLKASRGTKLEVLLDSLAKR